MKSMDIILAVCTTLGGLSAIWFFWDKISIHSSALISLLSVNNKKEKPELHKLSDSEFMFFDGLTKLNIIRNNYLPISEKDLQLCNSLVNHGFLLKKKDSSYKLTKEGKIIYGHIKNPSEVS